LGAAGAAGREMYFILFNLFHFDKKVVTLPSGPFRVPIIIEKVRCKFWCVSAPGTQFPNLHNTIPQRTVKGSCGGYEHSFVPFGP
jgi:hypothetical protein